MIEITKKKVFCIVNRKILDKIKEKNMVYFANSNLEFELIKVNPKDNIYIEILYKWNCNEDYYEYFTCRAVEKYSNFQDYNTSIIKNIQRCSNLCVKKYRY